MDWRAKPRKRDDLSPNWRDIGNEEHSFEHYILSPKKTRKNLNNDQKRNHIQERINSTNVQKMYHSKENNLPCPTKHSLLGSIPALTEEMTLHVLDVGVHL